MTSPAPFRVGSGDGVIRTASSPCRARGAGRWRLGRRPDAPGSSLESKDISDWVTARVFLGARGSQSETTKPRRAAPTGLLNVCFVTLSCADHSQAYYEAASERRENEGQRS